MENVRIPKKQNNTPTLKYIPSSRDPVYTCRLKVSGWAKICILAYMNQKQAGVSTRMSDKVDFRTRKITWTEEDITYWQKGQFIKTRNN